jgi:hypothetical protein
MEGFKMTIIAYKDGILAADTAVWSNGVCIGYMDKLTRWNDWTWAACGNLDEIQRWETWVKAGEDDNHRPKKLNEQETNFGALAIHRDGRRRLWTHHFTWCDLSTIEPAIHVQGSNKDFVMSALLSGMNAPAAIAHGIKHLAFAGGQVTALCTTWPEEFA